MIAHSSGSSGAGLEEDLVGDRDLADVVQHRAVAHPLDLPGSRPRPQRHRRGQLHHLLGVGVRVVVAGVDRGRQGARRPTAMRRPSGPPARSRPGRPAARPGAGWAAGTVGSGDCSTSRPCTCSSRASGTAAHDPSLPSTGRSHAPSALRSASRLGAGYGGRRPGRRQQLAAQRVLLRRPPARTSVRPSDVADEGRQAQQHLGGSVAVADHVPEVGEHARGRLGRRPPGGPARPRCRWRTAPRGPCRCAWPPAGRGRPGRSARRR